METLFISCLCVHSGPVSFPSFQDSQVSNVQIQKRGEKEHTAVQLSWMSTFMNGCRQLCLQFTVVPYWYRSWLVRKGATACSRSFRPLFLILSSEKWTGCTNGVHCSVHVFHTVVLKRSSYSISHVLLWARLWRPGSSVWLVPSISDKHRPCSASQPARCLQLFAAVQC